MNWHQPAGRRDQLAGEGKSQWGKPENVPSSLPLAENAVSTGVRQTAPPRDEVEARLRQSPLADWDEAGEPESELPIPEGELLGGKYTVERLFAEGGMGIICLGRHVQLDQPVAIKFLRRAMTGRPSIVQRFLNEARALAALRSEHVVRVMDVGQLASGRPYLVMEHLEGAHLEALLQRDGPLHVELAVSYVLQVCQSLAEAHALGIVHRDIKPENLFLWSGGPRRDTIKVLDFGLAKRLGPAQALGVTGPQEGLGSPCYMSPEQISTPQSVDSRTDIWSLGVVLYQLLSDRLPFDGNSLVEVLSHILTAAPQPLIEVAPDLDPELDAIVGRCLAKSPEARYQTMSELAEALTAYLAERQRPVAERQSPAVAREPDETMPPTSNSTTAPADALAQRPVSRSRRRFPSALFAVPLLLAAAYVADRSGTIHLRSMTDGRFTPAPLPADAPTAPLQREYRQDQPLFRGIFAADVAQDERGAPALRAVPERDTIAAQRWTGEAPSPVMSDEERAQKLMAYDSYLKSQGLVRISEALSAPSNNDYALDSSEPR